MISAMCLCEWSECCVVANISPAFNSAAQKTPNALAPRELDCVQQSVLIKRSASCGAVTVDDTHQPSTSHLTSAVNQATSAASADDPRYTKHEIVNQFLFNVLSLLFTQPQMRRMRICFRDDFFVFCFFRLLKNMRTVLGNG